MKDSILNKKSEDFAVEIINFYQELINRKQFDIARQILRSGTSIGANVAEGRYAQSSLDFINKLSIALKEANETQYWLKILRKSDIINGEQFRLYDDKVQELIAMLISSIKTVKNKIGK